MSRDYDDFDLPKIEEMKDRLRPTRHLNRKVLCGFCKFQCCNSNLFSVELSPTESKKLDLPMVFPQKGGCSQCLPDGCRHGDDKPVLCKLYPININERGQVGTTHFVTIHCPTPKQYEFVGLTEDGKYEYRRRPDLKGPLKNNTVDSFTVEKPLEEYPSIFERNSYALVEILGAERVAAIGAGLKALNEEDAAPTQKKQKPPKKKGFGLGHME